MLWKLEVATVILRTLAAAALGYMAGLAWAARQRRRRSLQAVGKVVLWSPDHDRADRRRIE